MRRGAAAATLVLFVSGCATLPPCPARGGPAWTEWTSSHFLLVTDLDEPDARAALQDLEERRAAVLVAAWRRTPEPRARLLVIALATAGERRVFVPAGFDAAFVARGKLAFVVKSGAEREPLVTQLLVHELGYAYGLGFKAPWFDEGLARYLETLRVDEDRALIYGDAEERMLRNVTFGGIMSFDELWEPVTPQTRARFIVTS
jgi:hypothetical protein